MKNYSKKTVADYIMGNDIEGFDIEELEDNVDFMMDVMRMSLDKKIYNFCSDKVKVDSEFVSLIITLFSKDETFITRVADNFLSKSDDNLDTTEILILMTKTISKDSDRYLKYAVLLFGIQLEKDTMITAAKETYKDDPEHLSIIGETGFSLIYDECKESKVVTDYFAEKALDKLFNTDSSEFEDLFHRLFKSLEELESINIKTYLINYISNYDSELASYVGNHPEVLNNILREISSLKNKWNTYSKRIDVKKYNMMFEQIHRCIEENGNDSPYTEDELLYTIGNELGITREIYEHDPAMPSEKDLPYEEALPDTTRLETGVISYDDLALYNTLKEIILKIYKAKTFKDLESLEGTADQSTEDNEIKNMLDELNIPDSKKSNVSNIIDFRNAIKK